MTSGLPKRFQEKAADELPRGNKSEIWVRAWELYKESGQYKKGRKAGTIARRRTHGINNKRLWRGKTLTPEKRAGRTVSCRINKKWVDSNCNASGKRLYPYMWNRGCPTNEFVETYCGSKYDKRPRGKGKGRKKGSKNKKRKAGGCPCEKCGMLGGCGCWQCPPE